MKYGFRQGVVRHQHDIAGHASHLAVSSLDRSYIDFLANEEPTLISFAHGDAEYLVEELKTVQRAWGPFAPERGTVFLYWEIDMVSGEVRHGFTQFPPVVSKKIPNFEREGQHWFDLNENVMKVWDTKLLRFMPKLRVFAASFDSRNVLTPMPMGSQVGLSEDIESGFIIFDEDQKPLRTSTGRFATSTRRMHARGSSFDQPNTLSAGFRVEDNIVLVTAKTTIPRLHCVSIVGPNLVELASYRRTDRIVSGVIVENIYSGEKASMLLRGVIHDPNWNFPVTHINKYLFCGLNGEVTVTPPPTGMSQIIGILLDTDSVFFDPQQPIRLTR
jgi:hypothetical protein